MGSDIVYMKFPAPFDEEDDTLAKLGLPSNDESVEADMYVLIKGNARIVSFNETSKPGNVSIWYFEGGAEMGRRLNITLKEFIGKLESQDITILD